jgi:hypothetical protein
MNRACGMIGREDKRKVKRREKRENYGKARE